MEPRGVSAAIPLMGGGLFPQKEEHEKMYVKIFVGNLPKSMTEGELTILFNQAGEVIVADLITDRNNGESIGFAFVTMSSRSDAERAIHIFNAYSWNEHQIKVNMAQPSFQL
ncbi:MAG: RNA-binding protein [Anaerolineales bacterium]